MNTPPSIYLSLLCSLSIIPIGSICGAIPVGKVESELQPGNYIEETYKNYTMRCTEGPDSARSVGSYAVYIYGSDNPVAGPETDRLVTGTVGHRDGVIEDCWMTNLDDDGKAEVLIFSRSVGSGSFGQLHVYKFDGTQLQAADLPSPDPDLMSGYRGRDWYELTDATLFRGFPLYLEGDANCCPQGGSRVIEYDSATNTWKLSSGEVLR